jgi:hypothetical protein
VGLVRVVSEGWGCTNRRLRLVPAPFQLTRSARRQKELEQDSVVAFTE